jgi:hypothetical protein
MHVAGQSRTARKSIRIERDARRTDTKCRAGIGTERPRRWIKTGSSGGQKRQAWAQSVVLGDAPQVRVSQRVASKTSILGRRYHWPSVLPFVDPRAIQRPRLTAYSGQRYSKGMDQPAQPQPQDDSKVASPHCPKIPPEPQHGAYCGCQQCSKLRALQPKVETHPHHGPANA